MCELIPTKEGGFTSFQQLFQEVKTKDNPDRWTLQFSFMSGEVVDALQSKSFNFPAEISVMMICIITM